MNVYRATPVAEHLTAAHWQRSTHKGSCVVRANSLGAAMDLAAARFDRAVTGLTTAGDTPLNPWAISDYVTWTEHPDDPALPEGVVLTAEEDAQHRMGTGLAGRLRRLLWALQSSVRRVLRKS